MRYGIQKRRLAAPLITGPDYGTRASTVVTIDDRDEVQFEERTRGPDGAVTGTARDRFALHTGSVPFF